MKKEKMLIIAEEKDLGLLAKWAKEETGMETKEFNIHKGFPSAKGISHVFIFISNSAKIKPKASEIVLFASPHAENFFHDKNLWIEINFNKKPIEELENKIRPKFKNNFKKEEKTFSSSKFASS